MLSSLRATYYCLNAVSSVEITFRRCSEQALVLSITIQLCVRVCVCARARARCVLIPAKYCQDSRENVCLKS
jgi:hypothetical protein